MILPGVEDAVVDAFKIRDHLLSDSHPVGRFKSAFFSALGYTATDWGTLASDLRGHARKYEAVPTERTEYGQKFLVRGRIQGPAGKVASVVVVWIVLRGEDFSRFVTAFPGARS